MEKLTESQGCNPLAVEAESRATDIQFASLDGNTSSGSTLGEPVLLGPTTEKYPIPPGPPSPIQSEDSHRANVNRAEELSDHDKKVRQRDLWDRTMKRHYKYHRHEKVAALILSYDTESDDLKTYKEVAKFESILKDTYGFETTRSLLNSHGALSVQFQMMEALLSFVKANDGANNLLIVYYAGHGFSNKDNKIYLSGTLSPNEPDGPEIARQQVDFSSATPILERTAAHVLLIFDCCHAGAICNRGGSRYKKGFQFLGACASGQNTRGPGKQSFTSALIWALESLKESNWFHTTDLRWKIQDYKQLPKGQQTVLSDLSSFEPSAEPICLAKASFDGNTSDMPAADAGGLSTDPMVYEYLDLRFVYNRPLTDDELESAADSLRKVINGKEGMISIPATQVNLLETSSKREMIGRFAKFWLNGPRRAQTLPSPVVANVGPLGGEVGPQTFPKPSISIVSDDGAGNVQIRRTKGHGTYAYHLTMLYLGLTRDVWDLSSWLCSKTILRAPTRSRGSVDEGNSASDIRPNDEQLGEVMPLADDSQEPHVWVLVKGLLSMLCICILAIKICVYLCQANGVLLKTAPKGIPYWC